MKAIFFIFTFLFSFSIMAQESGTWGQVIKSDKSRYGHQYFIYFKQDGKDYAYPIDPTSEKVAKELSDSHADYVQVFGTIEFEEVDLEKTKHIVVYKVNKIKKLTLKDLNENMQNYGDRLDVSRFAIKEPSNPHAAKKGSRGISDKATNTAIFVGGAVIAAEVLSMLLAH